MKLPFLLLFVFATLSSVAQTERINFTLPEFYPEGVAFDGKHGLFYTGSVKTGTIISINKQGKPLVFFQDSTLKSSFGMKVDSARNLLWVCTGDPNYSLYSDSTTYKKKIRIIAIDLNSRKKVQDHDLSMLMEGKHFPNDITIDRQGNLYITDSYSPVIYKIPDAGKGTPVVWAKNELFNGAEIGLNGIAWHPSGFLLAVNNNNGSILKIQGETSPVVQPVKINTFFPGADGLLIDPDENLVLVQNKGVNKIFQLQSKDDWKTATVKAATATEDRFQQPSTCTMSDGNIYVLNSKLNELQDPGITPSKEFSLQRAVFRPLK